MYKPRYLKSRQIEKPLTPVQELMKDGFEIVDEDCKEDPKGFLWDAKARKLMINGQEIPKVRKAVITLEAGKVPQIEIEQILMMGDIGIRDTIHTNFVEVPFPKVGTASVVFDGVEIGRAVVPLTDKNKEQVKPTPWTLSPEDLEVKSSLKYGCD